MFSKAQEGKGVIPEGGAPGGRWGQQTADWSMLRHANWALGGTKGTVLVNVPGPQGEQGSPLGRGKHSGTKP